jgi:hypothetical protein
VGGNAPQTQKPHSQGAWPLNPADVRGVKLPRGPAQAPGGPCRPKAGPGPAFGQALPWASRAKPRPCPGPKILTFPILNIFLVFHRFSIAVLVFHIVHMYFFETWFSCSLSLFLYSNLRFGDFVQIGSIDYFFFDMYFFRLSFFDFLFKIPFTMHNI